MKILLLSLAFGWGLLFQAKYVLAQIVPDATLGAERSEPVPGISSNEVIIRNGAARNTNLFHSFLEFNVSEGQRVLFNNPVGVTNILTRVTGSNSSKILGVLGVRGGNANLFLINPNGIFFGRNASLSLGGSFVATTANAIQFGDRGFFNASDPVHPSQLLTINPSAFFFTQTPTAPIQIESRANSSTTTVETLRVSVPGLRVPDGQNLLLIGGDVFFNGGRVNALQGRVELAGVAGQGSIGLAVDSSNRLFLNRFPDVTERANVYLTNQAQINLNEAVIPGIPMFGISPITLAFQLGGDVAIHAQNLILNNSSISSGGAGQSRGGQIQLDASQVSLTQSRLTATTIGNRDAGDIVVNAHNAVSLQEESAITSETRAAGNAGTVDIRSQGGISFTDSLVSSRTSSTGSAGEIRLQAGNDENIHPGSISLQRSTVSSETSGQGGGGSIRARAGTVHLTNSSGINANTVGAGDAGSILIQADRLTLQRGTVSSAADQQSSGKSGNIEVEARNVSLGDLSALFTSASSQSKGAGNITITAEDGDVSLQNGSRISSETFGADPGGAIHIAARTLSVKDSAVRSATGVLAQGNAGKILIDVSDSVRISRENPVEFGFPIGLSSSTNGSGQGGTLTVIATNFVELSNLEDGSRSGLFAATTRAGAGGNLLVNTNRLIVRDGAEISAFTSGAGNPGNIAINSGESIALLNGLVSTAINPGAVVDTRDGKRFGNISLQTRTLSLNNRSQITASTSGQGDAGNIRIQAADATSLANSSISTAVNLGAIGQGGNIDIQTGVFSLTDNAQVSASTAGQGTAGSVKVTASTFKSSSGGQIRTSTAAGSGAGSINLQILDSVTLTGNRTGLFASTDRGSSGNGGNIWIDPRIVTVRDGAKIAVDSQGSGTGGSIDLQAGRLVLDRGEISAQTASNQGGNINLQLSDLLLLRRNSQISTTAGTAQTGGDGGNIRITVPFVIAVRTENNDITANAFTGSGGRVDITTQGLFGIEPRDRLTPLSDITASSEFGVAGIVTINTPDVDPSRGLTELPSNLIDAASQISQGCIPNRQQSTSSFVMTGRGGLPSSPTEPLGNDAVMAEWVTVERSEGQRGRGAKEPRRKDRLTPPTSHLAPRTSLHSAGTPNANPPPTIVEAQSWMVDANGQIVLVAQSPVSNSRPWLVNGTCEAAKSH